MTAHIYKKYICLPIPQEIIRHPDYSSRTKVNDIALLRVDSGVKFSGNIRPACLRTELTDVSPSAHLLITGWGTIEAESKWRSLFCY